MVTFKSTAGKKALDRLFPASFVRSFVRARMFPGKRSSYLALIDTRLCCRVAAVVCRVTKRISGICTPRKCTSSQVLISVPTSRARMQLVTVLACARARVPGNTWIHTCRVVALCLWIIRCVIGRSSITTAQSGESKSNRWR